MGDITTYSAVSTSSILLSLNGIHDAFHTISYTSPLPISTFLKWYFFLLLIDSLFMVRDFWISFWLEVSKHLTEGSCSVSQGLKLQYQQNVKPKPVFISLFPICMWVDPIHFHPLTPVINTSGFSTSIISLRKACRPPWPSCHPHYSNSVGLLPTVSCTMYVFFRALTSVCCCTSMMTS